MACQLFALSGKPKCCATVHVSSGPDRRLRMCEYFLQAYWQSAIAARPSAAWKGYILGGLMYALLSLARSFTVLGSSSRQNKNELQCTRHVL